MRRVFLFIEPPYKCYHLVSIDGVVVEIGVLGDEGWINKTLVEIRPYCVENKVRVIELK